MMKKKRFIAILGVCLLLAALAPAAQADTVGFNDSAQLNLTGRDVLAAVNFYDPTRSGARTVGTIQGVEFDDFSNNTDDDGSAFNVAGGTFSTVITQSAGREYGLDLFGTFTGPDATEAENLANGGAYYQNGDTGTLTFAFPGILEPTVVEVQMILGGDWFNVGVMTVSVGGEVMGTVVEADSDKPQLLTFETTIDASGGLVIDLEETGNKYIVLSGMIVTVPVVNAGDDSYTWLVGGTRNYDLDGTIDAGIISPEITWSRIDTYDAGDAVITAGTEGNEDATVDIDVDIPVGDSRIYEFQLQVIDGVDTYTDAVNVTVYGDGCEAAKVEGATPYSKLNALDIGDMNYDCKVNLVDFATMASNWMTDVSL
jgi:hypothetical protein